MSERVAQDARVYRKTIRPRLVGRVPFNSPQEHSFMHDFFVHRGLKVAESPYSHYDEASHTFYHPTPDDKPAVAKAYLRWMDPGAVKLARGDETERGFQAAIAENPQESHNHLVYADWLDEHGAREDAAFRRSIGEWHQKPRDLTPPPPTYAADLGPSGFANKMRFWVHRDDLPQGITNADIPLWGPDTRTDDFDPGGTGYWPRDRVHAAFDYSRGHQGFRWGTYQHLEQAFRRAWDAGRLRATHLERVPGLGAATRAQQTDTHSTRLSVVRQILGEAGIQRSVVRSVLAHTDQRGVRPGVSVAIGEPVSKPLARYLGAWLGLMTGERKMTVFHPGEGEDTLHVIDSPHDTTHVSSYLKSAGVPSFSVEKNGTGTRVFIVDPMDLLDVQHAAGGLQATKQAQVAGTAVRLGANDSDSAARSNYRQVIQDAEGPRKLARPAKADLRNRDNFLPLLEAARAHLRHPFGVTAPDQAAHGALADLIGEITGNPADPRAQLLRLVKHNDVHDFIRTPDNRRLYRYFGPVSRTAPAVYGTGATREHGLALTDATTTSHSDSMRQQGLDHHPVVRWTVPIKGRDYHTFSAHVQPHELYNIIDQLPADHKARWEQYAQERGWHRPVETKPVKLAAISPPSSAQPSVIVKVPTPVPVQQTAKPVAPQAPEQPTKPSTGPTLIFPG